MKIFLKSLLLLCFTVAIGSAQITSAGSGYWNSSATWTGGTIPSAGNDVIVSAGHSVVIDIPNASCNNLTLDGTLAFPDTNALGITINGSLMINATGYLNSLVNNVTTAPKAHTIVIYKDVNVASGGRIDLRRGSGSNVGVARVVFTGTANSNITLSQTVYSSTTEEFNSVVINKLNGAKVVLVGGNLFQNNNSTNSPDTLLFISGMIETGENTWVHLATSASAVTGASSTSYVNGKLGRGLSNSGGSTRRIDVGNSSGYRPITVQTTVTAVATGHYVWARAIEGNANTGSSVLSGGIDKVSALRYYQVGYVSGAGAAQMSFARFNPSYRDNDGVAAGNSDLRVAISSDNRANWNGIGPSTDTTSLTSIPRTIASDSLTTNVVIVGGSSINVALARKSGTTTNSLQGGTSVRYDIVKSVPNEFALHQNYPNPFNPSTTIEFSVPNDGRATLKVFNVIGEEVAALFNENVQGGKLHRLQFDAKHLPSGMYFSVLQFGGQQVVKRMTLMK